MNLETPKIPEGRKAGKWLRKEQPDFPEKLLSDLAHCVKSDIEIQFCASHTDFKKTLQENHSCQSENVNQYYQYWSNAPDISLVCIDGARCLINTDQKTYSITYGKSHFLLKALLIWNGFELGAIIDKWNDWKKPVVIPSLKVSPKSERVTRSIIIPRPDSEIKKMMTCKYWYQIGYQNKTRLKIKKYLRLAEKHGVNSDGSITYTVTELKSITDWKFYQSDTKTKTRNLWIDDHSEFVELATVRKAGWHKVA